MLVDGGLWVIVGVWGSIGEVGMSLLLGAEWLGVCGGVDNPNARQNLGRFR